MENTIQWPEHLWPLSEVQNWIQLAVPAPGSVTGPTQIHNEKLWGVTAEFMLGDEPVIFKGCNLGLFAKRIEVEQLLARVCPQYVPGLMAGQQWPNNDTWTLHRIFRGPNLEEAGRFEHLLKLVRTLAQIQTKIAALPPSETATLPRTPVHQAPEMLDFMIRRIENGYLDAWLADDGAMLDEFELPANVLDHLDYFRPKVAAWTEELVDGAWPLSLDHRDFSIYNAVLQENGQILIFDWEEAEMSCPFYSMDRLLYDADDFEDDPESIPRNQGALGLTPNQMALREAYIDALPWHTRARRERAFDLALCLAPLKMAYETEPFNDALGRQNGLPEHAARCMGTALRYWQAMTNVHPGKSDQRKEY